MITMNGAGIAHGDLSSGNVMVRDNGQIVLVDYDSFFVPGLGSITREVPATPGFQHPRMGRSFSERMDDFSALVIYLAILAVATHPDLWNAYVSRKPSGALDTATLMFQPDDFENPSQSRLMTDIRKLADRDVQEALDALEEACRTVDTPGVMPPALSDRTVVLQQRLAAYRDALAGDDCDVISGTWSTLDSPEARAELSASEIARGKVAIQCKEQRPELFTLEKANDVGLSNNLAWEHFERCARLGPATQRFAAEVRRARELRHALQPALSVNDCVALNDAVGGDAELLTRFRSLQPSPDEMRSITAALRCATVVPDLLDAVGRGAHGEVARQYDKIREHFEACSRLSHLGAGEREEIRTSEQRSMAVARTRMAIASDDDQSLLDSTEATVTSAELSRQEQDRIRLALDRQSAVTRVRVEAGRNNWKGVVEAYDGDLLEGSNLLDQRDRDTYHAARLRLALASDERDAIADIVGEGHDRLNGLSSTEKYRIQQLHREVTLRRQVRGALDRCAFQEAISVLSRERARLDHPLVAYAQRSVLTTASPKLIAARRADNGHIEVTFEWPDWEYVEVVGIFFEPVEAGEAGDRTRCLRVVNRARRPKRTVERVALQPGETGSLHLRSGMRPADRQGPGGDWRFGFPKTAASAEIR